MATFIGSFILFGIIGVAIAYTNHRIDMLEDKIKYGDRDRRWE